MSASRPSEASPAAAATGRCSPWWLLCAAIVPAALLAVGATLAEAARLSLLARLLYFAPPAALLLAAVAGARSWRRDPPSLRQLAPGLLSAIALVVVVVTVSPPAMRVQFDETSLVSVSQSMHTQRLAVMTTGALPFDGERVPIENTVDKRPPLFAFLVSLLHDLTGERIENAFVANAVLLGLGLWLVFAAVRARLGLLAGFAAQVLLVAVPLTDVVATSAGFELLATVLLTAVVLAALGFVRRPDAVHAQWLLALGGLLAQARYESLPALLVLLLLAWSGARRRFQLTRGTLWMVLAQTALLAAVIAQLLHARDPNFYPEAAGQPLVALSHLVDHLPPFVLAWFAPALANPLPGVLACVGALGVAARVVRRRLSFDDALVAAPVAVVTGIALLWFFGDVREPAALRLFLPAAWLTALLPLTLLSPGQRHASAVLLVASLLLAGLRLADVAHGAAFPRLRNAELATAMERVAAAVERDGADRGRVLWVATTAQHLIVHGHAALSPLAFTQRADIVQAGLQNGQVRTVYVLETPLDAQFAPAFGDPQRVLRATASDVVRRVDEPRLVVHRLRLR